MRVLYFTKSAGYEHERRPLAATAGTELLRGDPRRGSAPSTISTFTFSKDGSLFSPEYLAGFDAVMFYTSGDLLAAGTDGHPPLTAAGKQALLDAVAGGKGFLGDPLRRRHLPHAGARRRQPDRTAANRYRIHGDDADPYIRMLGGEFINHGDQQVATARGRRSALPRLRGARRRVPLSRGMVFAEGIRGRPPRHPGAADRRHGRRRTTAAALPARLGAAPTARAASGTTAWATARTSGSIRGFQSLLVGGLEWASGRVDADITPNLAEATPHAAALPPEPAPDGDITMDRRGAITSLNEQ